MLVRNANPDGTDLNHVCLIGRWKGGRKRKRIFATNRLVDKYSTDSCSHNLQPPSLSGSFGRDGLVPPLSSSLAAFLMPCGASDVAHRAWRKAKSRAGESNMKEAYEWKPRDDMRRCAASVSLRSSDQGGTSEFLSR